MAEYIDLEKEQEKKDLAAQKDDVCPHCLNKTSTFPYIIVDPVRGWLECCSCGVVFSPLSLRKLKIEKATNMIKVPKLVVPG